MTFPIVNAVISALGLCFLLAFLWLIGSAFFKIKFPPWSWKLATALIALSFYWNISGRDAPKFTLQDEAGTSPSVSGEVKDLRPERLTDSQREEINQQLYNKNKRDRETTK